MLAVRAYIASLSEEWQQKIDLRVNGGLDPFFDKEGKWWFSQNIEYLSEVTPLEGELTLSEDDPDLPEKCCGGYITSCAAQFNPGQLVLAMAEQVLELGGRIATSCKVEDVVTIDDNKLKVSCNLKGIQYVQTAANVVHCWNGYGLKDKFLPPRLASKIRNRRC